MFLDVNAIICGIAIWNLVKLVNKKQKHFIIHIPTVMEVKVLHCTDQKLQKLLKNMPEWANIIITKIPADTPKASTDALIAELTDEYNSRNNNLKRNT